jgi:PadR family transcriptional regulator, regulatory protein AphA
MVQRSLAIEFALLGLLRDGPLHGYQLHQQISDPASLGLVWRIKQAHLYALLERFEKEGYISSTLQPQEDRPTRRVYQLTESGRAAFQGWLSSPVERPRGMRGQIQAKLYFIQSEDRQVRSRLIANQRQVCRKWLEEEEHVTAGANELSTYELLVYQFRAGQIQAMLDWLDVCEEKLR